ncbi:MAG: rod shape-determining protein MreC [Elusimicrobia bacterium]|nr:rod shape-determining protein MreC [Elusimicrobiota bacterium]MBK7207273.1 rod shape-determining protein MreC [Elusimicrobiota bacterium]MBK7575433.1 rod shape-determining protein MreC [Elusimicrobiota bacterium]MBK8651540.1 rod shape-determining protein MreC [Elusimicrobiota bacterium]MBL0250330.1 rod shape-determining protein MreC [Elusimicrobiota bacterium]
MFERHRTPILFGTYTLVSVCLLAWSADRVVQSLKHSFYYLWLPAGSPLVAQMDQWGRFGQRLARLLRADQRAAEFESRWLDGRLDTVRQKMVEEENDRLTRLLGLPRWPHYRRTTARVWAREATDWFHSVLVKPASPVGMGDAVVTVVAGRPVVLGQVREVMPDGKARVVLLTDPFSALSAHVDRTGDQGLVEGRGANRLLLNYLFSDADVRPGDEIVSSGLGGVFPSGLLIGRVLDVLEPSGGSAKRAILSPAARMGALREVLVVSPENPA